jgi:hypothetical protein
VCWTSSSSTSSPSCSARAGSYSTPSVPTTSSSSSPARSRRPTSPSALPRHPVGTRGLTLPRRVHPPVPQDDPWVLAAVATRARQRVC